MSEYLGSNLKLLCSHYRSIAEVCPCPLIEPKTGKSLALGSKYGLFLSAMLITQPLIIEGAIAYKA